MTTIFTPALGISTRDIQFAEKNGRGLRGLSQVGLALRNGREPLAAVAIYAESIPTILPNRVPGRVAAFDLFARVGIAVRSGPMLGETGVAHVAVLPAAELPEVLPELSLSIEAHHSGNVAHGADRVHPFSGVGKLIFGAALAELGAEDPALLAASISLLADHRARACTGTLRLLSGDMSFSVDDAANLVLSTGDGAAALALLEFLERRGVDLRRTAQELLTRLKLTGTQVTGLEGPEGSAGEGVLGTTTPQDLLHLLTHLCARWTRRRRDGPRRSARRLPALS